jgi:hypothetical protein
MKKRYLLLPALLLLVLLPACDSFVESVDQPVDSADDEALNNPNELDFVINGAYVEFNETHDLITVAADLLSDQFRFGTNGDATFPTYRRIDSGIPELNDNTVDGAFNALGQFRFLSDRIVDRVAAIDQIDGGFDAAPVSRNEALYQSNLLGGIARYFYASYFGLNPREGGGVIEQSAFIPEAAMYDSSRAKLNEALALADQFEASGNVPSTGDGATRVRLINSLIARTHLNQNNFAQAATFAVNGLQEGDSPLFTLHNTQSPNEWWVQAGIGRTQSVVQDNTLNPDVPAPPFGIEGFRSFPTIVENEPEELNRIPLGGMLSNGVPVARDSADAIEFLQEKYPEQESPIRVISWQENYLILAEAAIRGEDISAAAANGIPTTALELVNAVRASYEIDPLGSIDLAGVVAERDKELFAEGARLIDQRRIDDSILPWHLPEQVGTQQTWQYLPITQQERNDNPNL